MIADTQTNPPNQKIPRMEIFFFLLTRSDLIMGSGKQRMTTSKKIERPEYVRYHALKLKRCLARAESVHAA